MVLPPSAHKTSLWHVSCQVLVLFEMGQLEAMVWSFRGFHRGAQEKLKAASFYCLSVCIMTKKGLCPCLPSVLT